MDLKAYSDVICPLAVEALNSEAAKVVPESDSSSQVKSAEFEFKGELHQVITQNTKKTSKFSSLARNGNEVAWVINPLGLWYLMVNGRLVPKEFVTMDGKLMERAS